MGIVVDMMDNETTDIHREQTKTKTREKIGKIESKLPNY